MAALNAEVEHQRDETARLVGTSPANVYAADLDSLEAALDALDAAEATEAAHLSHQQRRAGQAGPRQAVTQKVSAVVVAHCALIKIAPNSHIACANLQAEVLDKVSLQLGF